MIKQKKQPKSGEPHTKFKYTKSKDFDELRRVFWENELWNHIFNHHEELFRCLKCGNLFHTKVSFNQHLNTDNGICFSCSVYLNVFDCKTTLNNHEQKHSSEELVCKNYIKDFICRGGFLKHIKYRHVLISF